MFPLPMKFCRSDKDQSTSPPCIRIGPAGKFDAIESFGRAVISVARSRGLKLIHEPVVVARRVADRIQTDLEKDRSTCGHSLCLC